MPSSQQAYAPALALINIAHFQGQLAPDFDQPIVRQQLADIAKMLRASHVEELARGDDPVYKLALTTEAGERLVAIKRFKRQSWLKDWHDRHHKSKAERSFAAAYFLFEHQIPTPAPIAWLERWENNRLLESYYLCLYEEAPSMRDLLSDIYYNQRDNGPLMDLLMQVAPNIRAMHDAGFMHRDLGNQNILVRASTRGHQACALIIDLNRAKIFPRPLTDKERGEDLARIQLPGAYLKIFKFIYANHQEIPSELDRTEAKHRRRFEWHTRTRRWRRPLRSLRRKQEAKSQPPTYPAPQNIWLWDEKSAQPMTVLNRQEKKRQRHLGYLIKSAWQVIAAAPSILKHYRQLLASSYQSPVQLNNRIGVALHPKSEYITHELKLLEQLGNPPVLIRFYHHEKETDWAQAIQLVEQLHHQNTEVMIALIQDRQALLEPERWEAFLSTVITPLANKVSYIEITHAFNRVKWGIWSADEYAQLMRPAFALQERFPKIRLTGPACIDFEYHPVIAALKRLPRGKTLAALSHLLYVDRRGAPENKQGKYSTLEKCALLKAHARWADNCAEKIIVSEVNWPVKYTGIWSPIGCPYEAPQWRRDQPGETEETYAWYMLRYLAIALCSGHVDQVFWWRLSAHGYGLVDDLDNFRARPAFNALKVFLSLLGNAQFIKKHPGPPETYMFEFQQENQRVLMAWANGIEAPLPHDLTYDQAFDAYGQTIESPLQWLNDAPVYLIKGGKI